jgi:hypothetical protein
MAEFHVGVGFERVDADPGNLNAPGGEGGHFFHFRVGSQQFGVAEHAFLNGGNCGGGADIGTGMAIDAIHTQANVFIVGKRDGLLGSLQANLQERAYYCQRGQQAKQVMRSP